MKIGLSLFAVAAAALLVVGCGGDKGGEDEANYDGWMLTRWKDGTALTGTVYLQLGEDGTFTLYQSIGTFGYARFTGTYALVGDPATGQELSGTYADGTPWDSSYAVEKMTKRELRLRALKAVAVCPEGKELRDDPSGRITRQEYLSELTPMAMSPAEKASETSMRPHELRPLTPQAFRATIAPAGAYWSQSS